MEKRRSVKTGRMKSMRRMISLELQTRGGEDLRSVCLGHDIGDSQLTLDFK